MDYPVQDLQFLDLTDADEEERDFLHTTLFRRNPTLKYPKLPWETHSDFPCPPAEWRPAPYASGESAEGSSSAVGAALDGGDCDTSAPQNASSPAARQIPGDVPEESQPLVGSGSHTNSVYPDAAVMSVPPQVPTSVPAAAQPPVITTMYHQIVPGLPLSNVYVGNVTANVNVHGFMSAPMGPYPHLSPQQVYTGEVPHESSTPPVRNGREARRGRSNKMNNKRVEGQYVDRNSAGRHTQDVIPTQPPPLVDSPPGNSNIAPQGFPPFIPMHHPHYQTQYYPPPAPAHLSHHPSAQHATGTPIYLPSPHPIYSPAPMYGGYTPHHQPPGAPPIMPFPAMQNTPVPTTENSVLGNYQVESSGAEERVAAPPVVVNKETDEHQQKQSPSPLQPSYQPEPVPEAPVVCQQTLNTNSEPVASGHNVKPPSYQQQQSEEDEYNQTNLMKTVVVNNRNVTEPLPFTENKQSVVGDAVNRSMQQSAGHQNFINDPSSKFLSEKVKVPTKEVDSIALNQASRVNISEASALGSESDMKIIVSGNTHSSAVVDQDKCQVVDVKTPLPRVDVPASSKPTVGHHVDSVSPFPGNAQQPVNTPTAVQHQPSGQNVTVLPTPSHSVEVPSTPVAAAPSTQKSWASLFRTDSMSSSPMDSGMMMATGAQASGASSNKPLACVKPFQNAVTVASDTSRRVSDGSSATQNVSPVSSPGDSSTTGDRDNFPQLASPSTDDPHLYRLGEFLSKYQLDHKALSLQPRGLTNRSNWCYINSTLQALLACPPFYNLMKALSLPPKRSGKSTTPVIDSMVQFVNEFLPLSAANRLRDRKEKALRKDDGSIDVQCGTPFEPSYIYKMLNSIRSDTFKVEGRQEDAEEFLGCLLNALNDEMLELIKLVEEPATKSTLSNGDITANGETSAQSQDEDEEWKVMGPKNKGSITRRADFGRTPISDIFRGQLRSRVQRAGDQSTDNVQPFFTLQLDIEKAQSVKDALEILVGRDQLEGVTCSRTNQEVEAWQQVTLEELPLVLLLHLKWFDYKLDGASKIVKCVEFPIDLKVDPKLMSSSSRKYGPKQKQYKLFAVVYHDGKEATKGHYITDVFHVGYGGWVRYDDSVVKAVQESNVLRPRGPRVPYLLYYRRFDTIGNTQTTPTSDKTR
ncbi:ubiquitin carboxyl-terminal hydrolase 10 isoform X2 [Periplaneta americana]|uniref:ubiquitin carboxyl-terminal hydrolase 10 isoform X2 n=1 Tax=Periplaneta americana TaxID=6978 RepID=UPI0037E8790E